MLPIKKLLPLTTQQGEVYCPRKGKPFPAVISVSQCEHLYAMSQSLCDSHNCKNNAVAKQELALIKKRSEKEEVEEQRSTKRQRRKMATGWGHGP
jgi:hypothetical protein